MDEQKLIVLAMIGQDHMIVTMHIVYELIASLHYQIILLKRDEKH